MDIPEEVKPYAEVLDKYKEVKDLKEFNIIHMYPGELCYPNGYYDSRWFKAVVYNTETMEKEVLGQRFDRLYCEYGPKVRAVSIFLDGSVLVHLKEAANANTAQTIWLYKG